VCAKRGQIRNVVEREVELAQAGHATDAPEVPKAAAAHEKNLELLQAGA
jgi:hypothetical protein